MNSPNHVLIGLIVYGYVRDKYGVHLDKASFLKGNTSPDHSLSFLRPHRMRYCRELMRRKIARMCRSEWEDDNRRLSKRLGVLCHYYSDFFCLAHNPEFDGSLSEHIQYEQDLLFYMSRRLEYFWGLDYVPSIDVPLDADEIYEHMHQRIQQKFKEEQDFEIELYYAIRSCIELVLHVFFQERCQAWPVVQQ
ncbi:zinc dependent phospholipase C family protein [Clostridium minihomine]|uniref:zinc dependent phospholipase C family protein n=1 Tax=Clostridium minihomine TaxID=2045012 RepID=UPI000C795426|nr:zinc dependent phospholipase C family protein [Clostridium minihomine]